MKTKSNRNVQDLSNEFNLTNFIEKMKDVYSLFSEQTLYRIIVDNTKKMSIKFINTKTNFSSFSDSNGVYVICINGIPFYVGETLKSIRTRIARFVKEACGKSRSDERHRGGNYLKKYFGDNLSWQNDITVKYLSLNNIKFLLKDTTIEYDTIFNRGQSVYVLNELTDKEFLLLVENYVINDNVYPVINTNINLQKTKEEFRNNRNEFNAYVDSQLWGNSEHNANYYKVFRSAA